MGAHGQRSKRPWTWETRSERSEHAEHSSVMPSGHVRKVMGTRRRRNVCLESLHLDLHAPPAQRLCRGSSVGTVSNRGSPLVRLRVLFSSSLAVITSLTISKAGKQMMTIPATSAQKISMTTQNVKLLSLKTPADPCSGNGQRIRRTNVSTREAPMAIFTCFCSLSSVSSASLGGSMSSTSGIRSFSCSHLKSLSGMAREPTRAMNRPLRIAHRLPTTHGQSLPRESYVTSSESTLALVIQPMRPMMRPPMAPAPTNMPLAFSIRMVMLAGPTALPIITPMVM
mmetsp:Transcript_50225/g.158265  ORF Transcript_50225/g.158265 Transcript_50225/m.158265 type:complete len:283 (+) Transcript_50225:184-1032(+)